MCVPQSDYIGRVKQVCLCASVRLHRQSETGVCVCVCASIRLHRESETGVSVSLRLHRESETGVSVCLSQTT